jgi:DNA modification methylase
MNDINQLILGDNLEILRNMDSESVDLIYLDPPFFSNRNYEVIWGDAGEVRSFQDRWSGGIDHYIAWLKERVIELHKILKPTGSIFLHCDWHANAYIRVEILDRIFGNGNFRNEIIWQRTNSKGLAHTRFAQNHDTIYYYSKSQNFIWNPLYLPHDEKYLDDFYKYFDKETNRRYRLADLTNPNKDRPNLTYEFLGITRVWRWTKDRMQEAYNNGLIYQGKPGLVPQLKRYLDEQEGNAIDDNWIDVSSNKLSKKERIGYPTQKPEVLLDRIIKSASDEGHTVLDPFVGGGTSIAVADKLNRRWIGIDQSVQAVKVTEMRLQNQQDLFSKPFIVQLHKYDYDTLRYKDAFEFEAFIINAFGGRTNIKQRSDLGLDGHTLDNTPIQVKRSDGIGRNVIDNFHSAIQRYDKRLYEKNKNDEKPIGYIIAFSFGRGAIEEVARLKNRDDVTIELIKVENIIPIAKKPLLNVKLTDLGKDKKGIREIGFVAHGESAAGIEFFSWDFNYAADGSSIFKAEVLLDKIGEQTWKFKPGDHKIAVKVVDNDGLEAIEVIKLKVNGVLEIK